MRSEKNASGAPRECVRVRCRCARTSVSNIDDVQSRPLTSNSSLTTIRDWIQSSQRRLLRSCDSARRRDLAAGAKNPNVNLDCASCSWTGIGGNPTRMRAAYSADRGLQTCVVAALAGLGRAGESWGPQPPFRALARCGDPPRPRNIDRIGPEEMRVERCGVQPRRR